MSPGCRLIDRSWGKSHHHHPSSCFSCISTARFGGNWFRCSVFSSNFRRHFCCDSLGGGLDEWGWRYDWIGMDFHRFWMFSVLWFTPRIPKERMELDEWCWIVAGWRSQMIQEWYIPSINIYKWHHNICSMYFTCLQGSRRSIHQNPIFDSFDPWPWANPKTRQQTALCWRRGRHRLRKPLLWPLPLQLAPPLLQLSLEWPKMRFIMMHLCTNCMRTS